MNTEQVVGNTSSSTPLSGGQGTGASEETQKSSHTPLFIVLLVIMLFAVGLGGVLLGKFLYAPKTSQPALSGTPTPRAEESTVTPTSDSIENWKTFTNTEYDFSLRHPLDWRAEQKYLDSSFKSQVFPEKIKYYVELTSSDELTSIQILPEGELDAGLENTVEGKAAIVGIAVTTYTYQNGLVMFTNFNRQNLPYFRIQVKPKNNEVDQILSTFKFLGASEPTPSSSVRNIQYAPPAGWKTHASPMGFTFSYPLTYSSPAYEVVKRQLITTDPNSIVSYCQIDLGLGDTSGIFIVSSYPGGSRRQHIMDLTALPFSSRAKISTQEAKLGNLSGLLVDFQDVDGSPPVPVTDHTAIFVKNNTTALIIHKAQVGPSGTDYWNGLLSSIKIDSNFSTDLNNCQ